MDARRLAEQVEQACRAGDSSILGHSAEPTPEKNQAEDLASLYRRAFGEYGTHALWNKRAMETPTPDDAMVIARALRIEGNREARRLAEQIEQACRAAH